MTYRKLFLILLLVSAVMMAGLWWLTARDWRGVAISGRPLGGGVFAGVSSGTLIVGSEYQAYTPIKLHFIHWPHDSMPTANPLFLTGFRHISSYTIGKHRYPCFVLSAPLWFPWLIFLGAAYVWMRRLENRSEASMERELASQAAARGSPSDIATP